MSAAAIREQLTALREAGERLRRRPAAQTLDALAALLETWRDPESGARQALTKRLPDATGFSESMVRDGLELALGDWTGAALHALVERELGGPAALDAGSRRIASGFDTSAVLLAGAIPSPTLLALVTPLVLRSPVLVKPSSHDPLTPRLVADSLAAVDAELGDAVALASFDRDDEDSLRAFLEADCVVATGSDETVASVAARARLPQRFVAFGHRVSVAVLGPDVLGVNAAMDGLAVDVALWNQLGCLSPVALYVVGHEGDAVDRAALALAERLAEVEARWPRGAVDAEVAATLAHERSEAEMRAASDARVTLHGGAAGEWTVVREADAAGRPAPLHRFVRIHPVDGIPELAAALRPLAPHLAAVGAAGFGAASNELARCLASLGASRVCPLGSMQAPPLDWCHDGLGVLLPQARLTDRELGGTFLQ